MFVQGSIVQVKDETHKALGCVGVVVGLSGNFYNFLTFGTHFHSMQQWNESDMCSKPLQFLESQLELIHVRQFLDGVIRVACILQNEKESPYDFCNKLLTRYNRYGAGIVSRALLRIWAITKLDSINSSSVDEINVLLNGLVLDQPLIPGKPYMPFLEQKKRKASSQEPAEPPKKPRDHLEECKQSLFESLRKELFPKTLESNEERKSSWPNSSIMEYDFAKWLVQIDNKNWMPFFERWQSHLENAYKLNPTGNFSFCNDGMQYSVRFSTMEQINQNTGVARALKREAHKQERQLAKWPVSSVGSLSFFLKPNNTLFLCDFVDRKTGVFSLENIIAHVLAVNASGSENYTSPSAALAIQEYADMRNKGLQEYMPFSWQDNPSLVLMQPGEHLYDDILERLNSQNVKSSRPPLVFQIQHSALWQSRMEYSRVQYRLAKQYQDKCECSFTRPFDRTRLLCSPFPNEVDCPFAMNSPLAWKYCWHGTSIENAQGIIMKGIDNRFSPAGGPRQGMTLQGKGNYVATPNAISKALNYCKPWIQKTESSGLKAKCLFATHVYAGMTGLGNSSLSTGQDIGAGFRNKHSTVNSFLDPVELCTFSPEQILPVALIVLLE